MFEKAINSNRRGNIGMGYAIAKLTELGYNISIPITDSQDYDLIADLEGVLLKVQVKTTSYKDKKSEYYMVALRTKTYNKLKSFIDSDCDLLFVLTESGQMYLIPKNEIKVRNGLTLTTEFDKYSV
jgi:putative endonuclease